MRTMYMQLVFGIFFILSMTQVLHSQNFTGKWKLKTNILELGEIEMLLNFEQTSDSTFLAYSRPEAIKDVVSGLKYSLIKNKDVFKNGSIVHIYNGEIKNDSLHGILTTPMINLYFSAKIKNEKMSGVLYGNNRDEYNFSFSASPFDKDALNYDYPSLITEIKSTFQNHIYDAEILNSRRWKKFFKNLDAVGSKITDDLELFFDFTVLSQNLKMSHINLIRHNPWDVSDEAPLHFEPLVTHKMIDSSTAYIQFYGFQLADTSIVRNFFKQIITQQTPNLIFDFRGASGGDYSSMFLAQYLVSDTYEAGFFIGNTYYKKHRKLPDENTVLNLPVYNGKSLEEFVQTVLNDGLLRGKVTPDKELHYKGNVYALIDEYSASATEPISYFLKQHKLATLVGEKTAGAMLSSSPITIRDDWTLVLPIADYYTSDRFRIEQKGVKPDIKIKSEEALDYVIDKIKK